MQNTLKTTWGLALVAALLALPATARAQDGRFSGTVLDQTGAFVPAATVAVKNQRTGEERTVTSSSQGRYVVPNLKPSVYTIRATFGSFQPLEYTDLTLAAGQEFSVDLELHAAGVTETVTVEGRTSAIDLSSARIGANVSEREVLELPVNGRQMSQLLLQAPGSQNAGTGTWQDIRFSGRAVEQNAIRYDGIEGSAIIDSAPGNLNGEVPTPFKLQASLENVQEFRVESSAYPAEFGTGSGGQVSVTTKSGANVVHGAAFEYYRSEKFDAPNYFDTAAGLPKSLLKQHQFGGSFGGPIAKDRAFFFGSYEAYRLQAGINLVEAVPSAAAWARAVPGVAALRPGFLAPGAVLLAGQSTNQDFDIAQLQTPQKVHETAWSGRVDFHVNNRWTSYIRAFRDQGKSDQPSNVAGQIIRTTAYPMNAVFNLQGILSDSMTNEFKLGYNAAPTQILGVAPIVNGIDFSVFTLNLSGSVANSGIAGQGASSGITVPGGLVRSNSAQNGHAQPYNPYTLSFIDALSSARGNHYMKVGGELRLIRMTTDRVGGTTYSFTNLDAFLNNQPSTIQFLGDLSAPSVFNNGAIGLRHLVQNYYIWYAQDEWHATPKFTLNYGVRYDYYTPMRERDNLQVKFNVDTGQIDPSTTATMQSTKTNFQPRVGATYALTDRTVVRGGFGMFVGPGQTEDQVQTVADSDRVSVTLTSGANLAFPLDPAIATSTFINNPNNRAYQPRAYRNEYTIPERIWQYTTSVQQDLGYNIVATAAYLGSQGRNLFLRSVANPIVGVVTNPNPASAAFVIRQFSIVQRDAAGSVTGVQNPYAEIDTKLSGGHDNYNALQLSLSRRSQNGLTLNGQYSLSRSFGNTSGSNEAQTAANAAQKLADFGYDTGYNAFDVRHTLSLAAVYSIPYGRTASSGGVGKALLGGWNVAAITSARSGLPIDVKITRPDIVYVDGAGAVFNNPAVGRTAVINTPNGGNSRNVRRPDLVPGVDPFVKDGGLVFLNPAAFATPKPGTYGNLERGSLHGTNFKQLDLMLSKRVSIAGSNNVELRAEIFNVLNTVNFTNPVATLPNALPTTALTEANKVQPGQAYSSGAAGTFGRLTSTVGRTVGLGTPRQIQFALRFNF
jgi:hypothetical protein